MRNPLTIEAFAEWAAKKSPRKTYDWFDTDACACAQYADYLGGWGGSSVWRRMQSIAYERPWTFGALATRLRASLNTGKG